MLTRGYLPTAYSSLQPSQVTAKGVVRSETVNGIPQTWAIARPVSAPSADGAPLYLGVSPLQNAPANRLIRAGAPTLGMNPPKLEMDPTDFRTWQRQYYFGP
jgi:hypothetical protein